jgi:hypothetical protein
VVSSSAEIYERSKTLEVLLSETNVKLAQGELSFLEAIQFIVVEQRLRYQRLISVSLGNYVLN